MWQEVEKCGSFIAFIPTVELMFRPFEIGNPTVGVAVKVRAHVSKDNVWYLWLGIYPSGFDAPLVESSAIRWGHWVVCFKVDEFGSFYWKTPVLPKFRQRESIRGNN